MITEAIIASVLSGGSGGKPLAYTEVESVVVVPEQQVVPEEDTGAYIVRFDGVDTSGVMPGCKWRIKIDGAEYIAVLVESADDGVTGFNYVYDANGGMVGTLVIEDGAFCFANTIPPVSNAYTFSAEAFVETVHKVPKKYQSGEEVNLADWYLSMTDFLGGLAVYLTARRVSELFAACKNGEPLTIRGEVMTGTGIQFMMTLHPTSYVDVECAWGGLFVFEDAIPVRVKLNTAEKTLTATTLAIGQFEAMAATEE